MRLYYSTNIGLFSNTKVLQFLGIRKHHRATAPKIIRDNQSLFLVRTSSYKSFFAKQLEKFLQARVAGRGRSGCGRCGDPDLDETGTGM